MTDISLAEKIAAVEAAIARRDEWISAYGSHAERDAGIIPSLEAVLADLRAMKDGWTPTELRISARRDGAEQMRERAAQVCEQVAHGEIDGEGVCAEFICARAIRALPVEEP